MASSAQLSLTPEALTQLSPKRIPPTPYQFFWSLVWREFRLRSLGLALLAATGIGLMGFEPILMRDMIDELRSGQPDHARVWSLFWWITIVWFVSSGANRLRDWLDLYTAPEVRKRAQLEVYCWLEGHSTQFFQDHMSGSVSQKVKQIGQAMVALMEIVFNGFVRMVVAILMAAIVLSAVPAYFFWTFLLWLVIFIWLSAWFASRCAPLFRAFGEQASASTGKLVDAVSNMDLVRANAKRIAERLGLFRVLDLEKTASMNTRRFLIYMMLVLYSALLLFQCLFIGLSIDAYLDGTMSLGDVVMAISLAAILVLNVWGLSTQLIQYFEQVGTLESALALISRPHQVIEALNAKPLVVSRGEIRFENVDYQLADGRYLFRDFNLVIRPNEKVGLVGPSGAGKSTLTRLLRRHFDLAGGRILIDDQDIATVTLDSLNQAIADVPQDPALFHRSLKENIGYPLTKASDEQIWEAARLAHCDGFIQSRPEGIDSLVGEGGVKLSGGERQRIALARAFIKNAPILVLDEATSALDSATEALIQDAIDRVCKDRTVVVIAHRLSTLTRMDRIVVIQNGAIREQGSHQRLLEMNGLYKELWQRQSTEFV
jgi:ATP-binding cassette subfamily B protein